MEERGAEHKAVNVGKGRNWDTCLEDGDNALWRIAPISILLPACLLESVMRPLQHCGHCLFSHRLLGMQVSSPFANKTA